jgi:hypothetical protein
MYEYCDLLLKNMSSYDALLGLGLSFGSLYFTDIIGDQRFGCFPILFVHGGASSGKTQYVSFLMNPFGIRSNDNLSGIKSSVPVSRILSHFSNLPIWYDEFRDNSQNPAIVGVLRGAYNGSGRPRGSRSTEGNDIDRVTAPVIVSGEHIPSDEAFCQRLIPVRIRRFDATLAHRTDEFKNRVIQASHAASAHIVHLIKSKSAESTKHLLGTIEVIKGEILHANPTLDDRTAKNYAIATGCYRVLVNPQDLNLPDYVIHGDGIKRETYEPSPKDKGMTGILREFIDDVQVAIDRGNPLSSKIGEARRDKDELCIKMSNVYGMFCEVSARRTRENPTSKKTILDQFENLECFIEKDRQTKLNGRNERYLVLRLSKTPDDILRWFNEDQQQPADWTEPQSRLFGNA